MTPVQISISDISDSKQTQHCVFMVNLLRGTSAKSNSHKPTHPPRHPPGHTHTQISGLLHSVLGVTELEGRVVSHWHQPLTLWGFLCLQAPSLGSCRVWALTRGEEVVSQLFTNHYLPFWAGRPPHQQLAGESTHSLSNHLKASSSSSVVVDYGKKTSESENYHCWFRISSS